MQTPLLFISYFSGIKGNCPAEWADDKIRVLEQAGRHVIVLTGLGSHVADRLPNVRYVRVITLSWNDYKEEIKELKLGGERVSLFVRLVKPLVFCIGVPFDLIMRRITNGISAGRWAWPLTAFPVALWLKFRYSIRDVFCTGGPTAAHVIGGALAALTKCRLYCEYQDPLLGATMTRSSKTRWLSALIEKHLARLSQKAIYVTKEAARLARERNPENADRILAIYPGSWRFLPPAKQVVRSANNNIEFLHLGTLYGNRNLDLFFQALDALRAEGFKLAEQVRIVNLGAVYCDTAKDYVARADFKQLDALERVAALQRAQQATCLLLVQHTDPRSCETIPYKTYDYFNLQLPILGILNNDELAQLICAEGGFAASAVSIDSIKATLKSCLTSLATKEKSSVSYQAFDISQQFLGVFE